MKESITPMSFRFILLSAPFIERRTIPKKHLNGRFANKIILLIYTNEYEVFDGKRYFY